MIVMKRAQSSFTDVFFSVTKPPHEIRHRQQRFSLVDLCPKLGVFHAVEVTTAHVPATSGSFADAAFLSVNVKSLAASAMVVAKRPFSELLAFVSPSG